MEALLSYWIDLLANVDSSSNEIANVKPPIPYPISHRGTSIRLAWSRIDDGCQPARESGYFANPLASTVESAHLTARLATSLRFSSGMRSSNANMTTPCANSSGLHLVSRISLVVQ